MFDDVVRLTSIKCLGLRQLHELRYSGCPALAGDGHPSFREHSLACEGEVVGGAQSPSAIFINESVVLTVIVSVAGEHTKRCASKGSPDFGFIMGDVRSSRRLVNAQIDASIRVRELMLPHLDRLQEVAPIIAAMARNPELVDWERVKAPESVLSANHGLITAVIELEGGGLVSILDVEQILGNVVGDQVVPPMEKVKTDKPTSVFFADILRNETNSSACGRQAVRSPCIACTSQGRTANRK